jgi:hypothetical protein
VELSGSGNKPIVRDLVALSKKAQAKLIFLCETRQKVEKIKRMRSRLGLRGFTGIVSNGMSGGFALFWVDSLAVDVQEVTERYIDVFVQLSPRDPMWRLTCVYGEPRPENRHLMWSTLQNLKTWYDLPWCVLGDFNECMWPFEHMSGPREPMAR